MKKKNPHAVALGRKGGNARSKTMTSERMAEIARMGGIAKAQRMALVKNEAQKHKARRKNKKIDN